VSEGAAGANSNEDNHSDSSLGSKYLDDYSSKRTAGFQHDGIINSLSLHRDIFTGTHAETTLLGQLPLDPTAGITRDERDTAGTPPEQRGLSSAASVPADITMRKACVLSDENTMNLSSQTRAVLQQPGLSSAYLTNLSQLEPFMDDIIDLFISSAPT